VRDGLVRRRRQPLQIFHDLADGIGIPGDTADHLVHVIDPDHPAVREGLEQLPELDALPDVKLKRLACTSVTTRLDLPQAALPWRHPTAIAIVVALPMPICRRIRIGVGIARGSGWGRIIALTMGLDRHSASGQATAQRTRPRKLCRQRSGNVDGRPTGIGIRRPLRIGERIVGGCACACSSLRSMTTVTGLMAADFREDRAVVRLGDEEQERDARVVVGPLPTDNLV